MNNDCLLGFGSMNVFLFIIIYATEEISELHVLVVAHYILLAGFCSLIPYVGLASPCIILCGSSCSKGPLIRK